MVSSCPVSDFEGKEIGLVCELNKEVARDRVFGWVSVHMKVKLMEKLFALSRKQLILEGPSLPSQQGRPEMSKQIKIMINTKGNY